MRRKIRGATTAPKPIPAALSEWVERSTTRRVHVRDADGLVILRDVELSTSAHLYAVFASTTEAAWAIDRNQVSWRLDLERQRQRAEAASKAAE
ncbi:MAG TPA: hypothetical protein VHB79_10770 [Polyangiaceae bacterium]|nr:hypothetical protein [Polyangiaceae bacterium]